MRPVTSCWRGFRYILTKRGASIAKETSKGEFLPPPQLSRNTLKHINNTYYSKGNIIVERSLIPQLRTISGSARYSLTEKRLETKREKVRKVVGIPLSISKHP